MGQGDRMPLKEQKCTEGRSTELRNQSPGAREVLRAVLWGNRSGSSKFIHRLLGILHSRSRGLCEVKEQVERER